MASLARSKEISVIFEDTKGYPVALAGTENRIANVRTNYNEAVTAYNATIRRFPTVLLANMFGFEKADFFEVAPGGAAVPEVNFE